MYARWPYRCCSLVLLAGSELPRIRLRRTSENNPSTTFMNKVHPQRRAKQAKAPPERGLPGERGSPYLHRLLGTLVSQRLPTKLLPEPDLSQKMSGLLRPNVLPVTELFLGFAVPPRYGSTATTTPPEIRGGPEGTLPERRLPVT